jgi:D-alanine-D-alanine ligase
MSGAARLALLFGGRSVEHEVSVVSARGVASALRETELELVALGVTGEGRWLSPERSLAILNGDDSRVEAGAEDDGVRLVVDPGGAGLLRSAPGEPLAPLKIDVLFPLVHGWGGEDGKLQGALELAGLPYVGSDVLGSAVGMDKAVARRICAECGLAQVPWIELSGASYAAAPEQAHRRVAEDLGFPVFVKPANGGSSVGITKVADGSGLGAACREALAHDRKIVVERGIDAREIECAVLGNDEPQASGLGEILPSREFYDYEAKYLDGTSELKIPAELDRATATRIGNDAIRAFRALGLCGFARVDFLLDRGTGEHFLNEVNTLPGFTPISMFPKLWEAAGLPYPRLVERLVDLARERWQAERGRRTRRKAE